MSIFLEPQIDLNLGHLHARIAPPTILTIILKGYATSCYLITIKRLLQPLLPFPNLSICPISDGLISIATTIMTMMIVLRLLRKMKTTMKFYPQNSLVHMSKRSMIMDKMVMSQIIQALLAHPIIKMAVLYWHIKILNS